MSNRYRAIRLTGVMLLGLLAGLSPAHAGLKLYAGSLQFHAFGNTVIFTRSPPTTTGGNPLPTYTKSSFYAIPIGHFCNYQNLTHFVSNQKTYTGTRFISTAYPAPRSTQVMNCATTTKQHGAPITGGGTASTFPMTGASSVPAIRLRGGAVHGTVSGSWGYRPPYVYWVTYATLATGSGTLFPGGGPGRMYLSRGGSSRVFGLAGIYPRPGKHRFGGTMRLLGHVRSTGFLYSPGNGGAFGHSIDWLFDRAGASARGYDCWLAAGASPTSDVCPSVATNHWTWTDGNRRKVHTPSSFAITGTTMVYVDAFRWTTGLVVVTGVRGAYPTVIVRSGYDNRTAMGSGTVQLVSPHLANWVGSDCPFSGCAPRSETTAGIAILRLQFVPEPSGRLLLACGLGLLAVLYRIRC